MEFYKFENPHIFKKMNSNSSLGPLLQVEWSKFTNQNRAYIGFSESAPWIWCLDEDKLRHLSFKQMWPMYFFLRCNDFLQLTEGLFFYLFQFDIPKILPTKVRWFFYIILPLFRYYPLDIRCGVHFYHDCLWMRFTRFDSVDELEDLSMQRKYSFL